MSIASKEDLLNKQKEAQKRLILTPVVFLSVQEPDVWLPAHRKFMMKW